MELQDYHGDPTKTADALLDGHEVVEDLTAAVFITERLRGCGKSQFIYSRESNRPYHACVRDCIYTRVPRVTEFYNSLYYLYFLHFLVCGFQDALQHTL